MSYYRSTPAPPPSATQSAKNESLRAWLRTVDDSKKFEKIAGDYGLDVSSTSRTSATNAMRFLRSLQENSPNYLRNEDLFPSQSNEILRGRPLHPTKDLSSTWSSGASSSTSSPSTSPSSSRIHPEYDPRYHQH